MVIVEVWRKRWEDCFIMLRGGGVGNGEGGLFLDFESNLEFKYIVELKRFYEKLLFLCYFFLKFIRALE